MTALTGEDLFDDSAPAQGALRQELLEAIREGRDIDRPSDLDAAAALSELLRGEFMAFGTGGSERLSDRGAQQCVRTLRVALRRIGVEWSPRWRDFTSFRSYWLANDGYHSWAARREMVGEEYGTLVDKLDDLRDHPSRQQVHPEALHALKDAAAIRDHLLRMNSSVDADPRLAVSVAKDLVESTAKLVLRELSIEYQRRDDLPSLVGQAQKALGLSASGVSGQSEEARALKGILGSLTRLTQGITELRNQVGVGHGRESVPPWVRPRHARLAAGASSVWCNLMLETLMDQGAPWRQRSP